ncbi:Clp protease N-terminal domain-containing protein, partial [Actinomadura bangladeshensis]
MDPFEEMLARFFGSRAHRRPQERISIARLMSEPARELVRDAAAQAAQWGSVDLDTDHLLWAATRQQGTRQWIVRAGADPDKIKEEIESHGRRGEPRDVPPELTPSAKRALLDSHQVSRALGSSYIGPEHVLFALALDRGSSAGRILDHEHVTPDSLQQAATGGGPGQP